MDSRQQEQIANRLKILKRRFIERLKGELVDLEKLAEQLERGSANREDLLDCSQRLHQLAGSAGTFGFPELGQCARELGKRFKCISDREPAQKGRIKLDDPDLVSGLYALIAVVNRQRRGQAELDTAGPLQGGDPDSHGMQVRLLVMDDGRAHEQLRALSSELRRYGFDVVEKKFEVSDGPSRELEETIEDFSAIICHYLAVDIVAEKLAAIDAGQYWSAPPVLCVGDKDGFQSRYRVADHGGRAFFPEPVDFPELVERIESLVEEKAAGLQARVMIVEDDRELAEHYCLVLESVGVKVRTVSDPLVLMEELHNFEPELLLMDIELGKYSGVTLARMVRFQARWLSLPIIYLSSEDDPERQLKALSGGADEFLVKPVSDDYLIRSVKMRCHRARQLADLMNRDSLTRLLKHSLIKQEVERERLRCLRGGYQAATVLIDIDHFKRVNDTWGHGQGDVVIRTLANLLRNRLRESDVIGRYGGEEFLAVLPRCDIQAATALIVRILDSFRELEFVAGDAVFRVTFSAGIALLNDFDGGDHAIDAADRALYAQKRSGRNGVTVYQPGL